MKAREPWTYVTGSTLEASRQAENLRILANDVQDAMARRFYYSSFVLDWSGLTNTSNPNEFFYTFAAPWAYEIVGVELQAATTATGSATLNISGSVSNAEPVTVTFTNTGSFATASANFIAPTTASNNVTYALTVNSTTFTFTAFRAIIHIRTDRGNDNVHPYYTMPDPYPFTYGQAASLASFTNGYSGLSSNGPIDSNGNATTKPTIQVFTTRNVSAGAIPTPNLDLPVAAQGITRRFYRISLGLAGQVAGDTYIASVLDTLVGTNLISVTGTVSASTTTQSLATTNLTGTIGSQPTTDPVIRINRVLTPGSALALAYAVVFWG